MQLRQLKKPSLVPKQMKKNLSEEARKKETEVSLLAKGPTSKLLVETTKNKSMEELESRN